MNDEHRQPIPDPQLRALLIRLLHQVASDKTGLPSFSGGIWLTFPHHGRLRPLSLSSSLDPGMIAGQTFPQMLSTLSCVLVSEHGQVLCRSLLDPGVSGAVAIGQTMFYDPAARSLVKPRPMLVGVLVQLDGREAMFKLDPDNGTVEEPGPDIDLGLVLSSTWAIAEAIDNMVHAPMPDNAEELAQQVLDLQPSVQLAPGRTIAASGSNVPGTLTNALARQFVKRAAAAAAAESQRHTAAHRGPTMTVAEDASVVVSAFTKPRIDQRKVVTRTYRTVE